MENRRTTNKSRTFFEWSLIWVLVAPGAAVFAQDAPAVAGQRAFLKTYCVTCHNDKARTAGLSLERVNLSDVTQSGEALEKVVRKLGSGAMPPASAPKPDKATAQVFLASLETSLDQAAAAHPNPGRPMMMHRLNRTEYLNAVHDLFHADLSPRDAALLPPDDTSFGFDNNGDILGLSPLLLERYLSVANRVTTAALGPTSGIDPDVYTHHVEFTVPQREWIEGLPLGTRGGTTFTYRFPVDGEYTIRVKLQRVELAVLGLDDPDEGEPARPQRLEIGLDGARVGLFAITLAKTVKEPLTETSDELLARIDEPAKKLTTLEEEQRRATADAGLEVRLFVKAGERRVSVAFLTRFEPLSDQIQQPFVSGQGGPPRLLGVDSVFVAGPFNAQGTGDIAAKRRILTCQPSGPADETACAKKILEPLAHRAYHRPITGNDMDQLLTAYSEGRMDGTFEAGIATGIRRMLMDPAFLFRIGRDPAQAAPNTPYRISDLELASRLSFFLWSSIPDEPLLAAAERGQLRDPAVLQSQVKRMLADPRARNLVTNFGSQWLQLSMAEGAHPDPVIFTDFDSSLRQAFIKETELLLQSVLLGDRSVLELLNAKYTFVNERLASHYGIPGVYGDQFRRVEVNDGIRGGLLGQGSILTGTSYPTRTSPVLRGKWILEALLGSPPPPPPPDVPALPEAGEGGKVLSVRERLSEHRKNPACASCHVRMDPLGFALENFDATGRWRTVETNGPADLKPQTIDASAQLPDGTKFDGVAGLRHILEERSDQFVYTMTENLLTFALGRGADWYDAPAIREAVRAAQKNDYRFATLVTSIVSSRPFQMRMSQSADDTPRNSAQRLVKEKGNCSGKESTLMFVTKMALDRRMFLRGVGATLALPLLDAMTPAFAAPGKAIPRLSFMYVPNGINIAQWTPAGSGKDFVFSSTLKSLEPFRERVNVLSGLALHSADRMGDGAGDHSRATGAFLSGCHAKRTQGADLLLGITADQIAAKSLGKDNLLPSLELGIADRKTSPLCDEGYTCTYSNTLSWSSATTPLPVENNPRLVFERLFGEGGDARQRGFRLHEDRSILDSVTGAMKQLQGSLGTPDRRRVDQYFDAIRQVELRLQRVEAQNAESPTFAAGISRPLGAPEKFEDHIHLMMDLQVLAFQADITRVTTLMFAAERSGRSYPEAGVPDSHHSVSHHDNSPEKLAKVAKIDAYHVQQVAYLLGKLRDTKDGDGTLLDNSMLLYGAGISNGNVHDHSPLPVLLCGGGAGRLQGGRHIEFQNEPPLSNVVRGMLDKAGVHADQLGESTGIAEL